MLKYQQPSTFSYFRKLNNLFPVAWELQQAFANLPVPIALTKAASDEVQPQPILPLRRILLTQQPKGMFHPCPELPGRQLSFHLW